MKKFLIIFFVVLAGVCTGQPSISWMRLYDSPYHMDDYAFKIISADSGNFYIIGRATIPTYPYYGVVNVYKIDAYGKIIWNSLLDTIFQFPNSGALTPEGGCITVGSGGGTILKINKEGSLVWYKRYNNLPVQLWDVIRTEDSGYVACGYINSIRKDGYIIKIDLAGNFQWDKIIYANDWIMLLSIVNGIDSGYVVTGFTNDILPSKAVLYKLSNLGSVEDLRTYNVENRYSDGVSIKRYKDGYLLGGNSVALTFVMMLNENLDSIKTIKFLDPPFAASRLMDICVINNNKIAMVSEYDSTENHFDYSKILFTDTLGNVLRSKNFYSLHPLGFVKLISLLPLADGGIVSAGYSDYYGKDNNDDYISVRTDSLLNSPTVGISEQNEFLPKNFILYQNYPNPFNPKTSIEFYTPKKAMIVLEIFDIAGRKIFDLYKSQTNGGSYKVSWDASSYASGIYFVTMTADNIRVDSRKIVLLK